MGSTTGGFVDALYLQLAGSVDAAGRAYWVSQLNLGLVDRYLASLTFLLWSGARTKVVDAGFGWYLDRSPTVAESTLWLTQLTAGVRQEAFYASLLGSAEYFAGS